MIGTIIIVAILLIAACVVLVKVIKKLFVAILACLLLVLIVVGGFGFFVYQDVTKVMSIQNADVTLVFMDGNKKVVGYQIPVVNKQPLLASARGVGEVDRVSFESATDSKPVITLDKSVYSKYFVDSIDLAQVANFKGQSFSFTVKGIPISIAIDEYNVVLTKDEVFSIIESGDGYSRIFDLMLQKNKDKELIALAIKLVGEQGTKTLLTNVIQPKMQAGLATKNVTLQEALFFSALDQNKFKSMNLTQALDAVYADQIEIYPNHLTLDVVKALPKSLVESQVAKYVK